MGNARQVKQDWRMLEMNKVIEQMQYLFCTLQLEHSKQMPYEQCEDMYQQIAVRLGVMRGLAEHKEKHGPNVNRSSSGKRKTGAK